MTVEIKTNHWKPQTGAGQKENRPAFLDHLRNRLIMTDLSNDTPVASRRSEGIAYGSMRRPSNSAAEDSRWSKQANVSGPVNCSWTSNAAPS